jgi:hypothetical protein
VKTLRFKNACFCWTPQSQELCKCVLRCWLQIFQILFAASINGGRSPSSGVITLPVMEQAKHKNVRCRGKNKWNVTSQKKENTDDWNGNRMLKLTGADEWIRYAGKFCIIQGASIVVYTLSGRRWKDTGTHKHRLGLNVKSKGSCYRLNTHELVLEVVLVRAGSEEVYEVGLYTTHGGRGEANLLYEHILRYFRHL